MRKDEENVHTVMNGIGLLVQKDPEKLKYVSVCICETGGNLQKQMKAGKS